MSNLQTFSKTSGYKVLAMARLDQIQYSIVLYLINCAASGLSDVITTPDELSSLIGYTSKEIDDAIISLTERNIISIRYPKNTYKVQTMAMHFQFDYAQWKLDFSEDVTSTDALIFPFRRRDEPALQVCRDKPDAKEDKATWKRVFNSYIQDRSLDHNEIEDAGKNARILVETHPVDQVLLMLRHFGKRLPNLSALVSSWQHFSEIFNDETQKIDLEDAKQKHLKHEESLRSNANKLLFAENASKLSDDERSVLRLLISHKHPRRQLFWAYQSKNLYPGLKSFFESNVKHMVSVTGSGKIVPKN